MRYLRHGRLVVLYDRHCGFCEVLVAMLLTWDREKRLDPVAIQSARGQKLLTDVASEDRLESWHLIDGAGVVRSGGAALPPAFAALPGGVLAAGAARRFPETTSRAYQWVARHRVLLGRLFKARSRAWAARVVAERRGSDEER
jgi:predicted DCC family thiol-disulfide oxidoreductase YuxK